VNGENSYKGILGLSTAGSIALGEMGFQYQKKYNLTSGQIEMLRYYGILGGGVGLASAIAIGAESSNVYGGLILAGGVAGILSGNRQAKMYNYTKGDVNAISSLSLASSVLGLALAVGILDGMQSDNNNTWPVLIPAASAILATSIGQRQVRNVHLTKKQGSTLRLSTYGGGMVGLGLAAMLESESPAIYIGLPAGLALLTQQLIFNSYKSINLSHRAQASSEEGK